jgi:hypothetical protein
MADIAFLQQHAIIAVDIANAFNTVHHRPIFDAIMERHRPMARFFRWKYGTPSEMRDHSGNIVAHTRTGVGQGDPFGGNSATKLPSSTSPNIFAAYNRESPHLPFPQPGRVVAYEDDTQVMGPTILMFRIDSSIALILAERGFYMNTDKSYITGYNTDMLPDQPDDFSIIPDCLTVLGVPTGTDNFRHAKAQQILKEMAPPTAVLSLLNPLTALHFLIQWYNQRPAYLFRTTSDFSTISDLAKTFDNSAQTQ